MTNKITVFMIIQELLYRLAFELYVGDGGSPALIHKGRKILLKSHLAPSTVIVILVWKRFLALYHSNTYAAEWEPGNQNCYVKV